MTDTPDSADSPATKGSKLPLIVGLVLALAGGGGGYFAVSAGILGGSGTVEDTSIPVEDEAQESVQTFAFVAIDPLVISLPSSNGRDHLRFAAQLEVDPAKADEVEAVKPRIVDVLNSYLRAVALSELEDPSALIRLRAQMLRRIQLVTGPGHVHDLLIMEFVLS